MRRRATAEAPGSGRRPARSQARRDHCRPAAIRTAAAQDQFSARLPRGRHVPVFDLGPAFGAQCTQPRRDDLLELLLTSPDIRRCARPSPNILRVARGVDCRAEQVIVVTGAQAALDLVCARSLMDEGDVAWMEEPGYIGARAALSSSGARLAPLRVGPRGWALGDPDLPPPRLIYVTPSCQWPSERSCGSRSGCSCSSIAERHARLDRRGRLRRRVPVSRPAGAGHAGPRSAAAASIYVGTFGKTLFPSLRLGFIDRPTRARRGVRPGGQRSPASSRRFCCRRRSPTSSAKAISPPICAACGGSMRGGRNTSSGSAASIWRTG